MSLTKVTNSMILGSMINVLDYGADPTGANDSAAAFNLALAAGINVYIPEGTYRLDSNIIIPPSVSITGTGDTTILKPGAAVTVCLNQYYTSFIHDLYIDGTNTTGAIGILCGDPAGAGVGAIITNVRVQYFKGAGGVGISLQKALRVKINKCYVFNNTKGLHIASGADGYPTTSWISESTFSRSIEEGVLQECGYQIIFNKCIFESNQKEGFKIDAVKDTFKGALRDCWFENNWYLDATRNTSRWSLTVLGNGFSSGVYLENLFFAGPGAAEAKSIYLDNVNWTTLSEITPTNPPGAVDNIKIVNALSVVTVIDNGGRNTLGSITNVDNCVIYYPVYANIYGSGGPSNSAQFSQNSFTVTATASTSGTITLSNKLGYYVRQGRIVTVTGQFVVSGVSSPVGVISIDGLPFPASAGTGLGTALNAACAVFAYNGAATLTSPVIGRINSSSSSIDLFKISSGALTNIDSDLIVGTTICVQCTYIAD
jgi:hypothetical protein